MDIRYRHPLVTALWEPEWTYAAWWSVERAVLIAQLELGVIDDPDAARMLRSDTQPSFGPDVVQSIRGIEARTRHDVAAFVEFMRGWWGEPLERWIHFGLTSSDVVDTAQGLRFRTLTPVLEEMARCLMREAEYWQCDTRPILGRTHGQPAEPTAVGVRAAHWGALLAPACRTFVSDTRCMQMAKLSGPVGTYAHNPPAVERHVAQALRLRAALGASQIAPRGNLGRWANSAAELAHACAKVAMDIRLMNLTDEAYEPQEDGQVGSSSMAHKNNPIRAEQITGLARVAAGYASMLQPLDLWLERDISHSSVERIAVPGLWHAILHILEQTATLLQTVELRDFKLQDNLELNANAVYTSFKTVEAVRDGMGAAEARKFALDVDIDAMGDVKRHFLSNYPWKTQPHERT